MDKVNLRAVFEKSGRAVFISHLDLMRTMQRALSRSGVPVWYSQGFNPHIYINFPLALSLGVKSSSELMDFAVTEDISCEKIRDMLNSVLPDGLHIISVGLPKFANKDIGFCEYIIDFYSADTLKTKRSFDDFMLSEKIEVIKNSKKKGAIILDIKPHIQVLRINVENDYFRVNLRLPASQEISINSNVFSDAFSAFCGIDFDIIRTERTNILCLNGDKFV